MSAHIETASSAALTPAAPSDDALVIGGVSLTSRLFIGTLLTDLPCNTTPTPTAACIGCHGCESRCPFGVKVADRMIKTAELFGC